MTNTPKEDELKAGSDDHDVNYEVEYLDPDSDYEENTPEEIEYIDMDRLELEDDQQNTTSNIPTVNTFKTTSEPAEVYALNTSRQLTKPDTARNSISHDIETFKPVAIDKSKFIKTYSRQKKSITVLPLHNSTLREFMKNFNWIPIDSKIDTLLHNQLTATMTQLQKENKLKVQVNTTSLHPQKQLDAITPQNPTDSLTKTTPDMSISPPIQPEPVSQRSQPSQPSQSSNLVPQVVDKSSALKRKLADVKKKLAKQKRKETQLKLRLKQSKDLQSDATFTKIINKMPRIARMITKIQLRESRKPNRGRRFTEEEKELALSLHKQCPSVYKYMLKMGFILPNVKGLRYLDIQSDLKCATNRNNAISKLKAKVEKMSTEDRLCTLQFDEKIISSANRKKQVVTTFGNSGEEAQVTFEADHALIFMIKGILKYYQEPVSYTFSFGPTSATDLAVEIKSVISDLQAIGLIVLATICDQGNNNRLAIELLIDEARCDYILTDDKHVFIVNSEHIIPLFDPPHLLKGIRNHLISKSLVFEIDEQIKTAQWRHLEMMLKENPEYNGVRLIPKFTENIVYPTKQGIRKTKYASQVFSQTIATYMRYLAEKEILPPESKHTADLLLFLDQLFDSLNGNLSNSHKQSKPFLSAVKPNSAHHQKWAEAIKVFKTMKFANTNVVAAADINCWVWTLEGYISLTQKLFSDYKAGSVWMRYLNQDVLEKLFRTEVNPNPVVREKRKRERKQGFFAGEVVTQKVIKAINRINNNVILK